MRAVRERAQRLVNKLAIARLVAGRTASQLLEYARFCARTSSFTIPAAPSSVLDTTWDAPTPTIYVYWHDEFVLNLLLPLFWKSHGVRDEMPVCAANDAFGGEVIQRCLGALDVPIAVLSRGCERTEKLACLADALVRRRRLLLSADYGSPWFRAKSTAFEIAAKVGGNVVAMHLQSRRDMAIARGGWRLRLPLPYDAYSLLLEPVETAAQGLEAATRSLTARLHALRSEASAHEAREASDLDPALTRSPPAPILDR
jgi:hypothetical protein